MNPSRLTDPRAQAAEVPEAYRPPEDEDDGAVTTSARRRGWRQTVDPTEEEDDLEDSYKGRLGRTNT